MLNFILATFNLTQRQPEKGGRPMLTRQQIEVAATHLKGIIRHTELFHSPYCSRQLETPIYFKCENLQYTGAFKIRGIYNDLSQRPPQQLTHGVITASIGNHAKGLAGTAAQLGIPCHIVMPTGTPLARELFPREHKATVELFGLDQSEAEKHAREIAEKDNLLYVAPGGGLPLLAGYGTIGLEILADLPELDTLLVPIGRGSLIAGIATAVKETKPTVRIIGVETAAVPSATLARRNGKPKLLATRCHTFAREIAINRVDENAFPLIEKYVDDIVTVEEEEIARAVVSLMENSKLVVEGAGAASLAALLDGLKTHKMGNTVCLLSGGNLEIQNMARVIEQGILASGHYLKLRLEMTDIPGALAHLTHILGELKTNIFQISHDRHKSSLPLGRAEVLLDLETSGPEHIQDILLRLEDEGYSPEVV